VQRFLRLCILIVLLFNLIACLRNYTTGTDKSKISCLPELREQYHPKSDKGYKKYSFLHTQQNALPRHNYTGVWFVPDVPSNLSGCTTARHFQNKNNSEQSEHVVRVAITSADRCMCPYQQECRPMQQNVRDIGVLIETAESVLFCRATVTCVLHGVRS